MQNTDVEPALGQALLAQMRRDLLLAFRHPQDIVNPLAFLIMVTTLFPLAVTPDAERLAQIAPGVVWVGALLAALLSLDNLFRGDAEDGSLELLLLAPHPLYFLVLGRALSHWLTVALPLAVCAPLIGYLLSLESRALVALFLALLIGTPLLSLIGAIGAALLAGVQRGGVLLFLLVLPLFVPVLVFGAGAVMAAQQGLPYGGQLAILGALLALAVTLSPFATAAALRISLS